MCAQIKVCFQCPRCEAGITSIENTVSCPGCGLPLGKQPVSPYSPPYSFSEQHLKYTNTELLLDVLSGLPIEKANSIMNDALLIIENIAGKKTPVEGISLLVRMAIRIGEIAKTYEEFLTAGGKHFPSFLAQQQQKNQEKQDEPKNQVGRDPTSAVSADDRGTGEPLSAMWNQHL
jgi:hypothetical protein